MPELIQQQRTMQVPGQGIVRANGPTTEYVDYPKWMRHDGFAPATLGEEVVAGDPNRPAFKYHKPGTAVRYPHVLVRNAMDEEHHTAMGYHSQGACSEVEFRRMVSLNAPPVEMHVSVEYPKWVAGKLVHNAEQEAAITGKPVPATPDASGQEPATDVEMNALVEGMISDRAVPLPVPLTEEDAEIAALEAKIAKAERIKALKLQLAELEGDPVVTLNEAAIPEPLVMKEPVTFGTLPVPMELPPGIVDGRAEQRASEAADFLTAKAARAANIKAGIARSKAEKAAKAALTEAAETITESEQKPGA